MIPAQKTKKDKEEEKTNSVQHQKFNEHDGNDA